MLIQELAEKIVNEVRKLIDEDIIFVDTNGLIIASTDPSRINTFHEGALIASRRKEKLIITESDQASLKGVKAGINLPVFFQRDVAGVIGITGNPEDISQYGEIIRKMTELLVSEIYYTEQFDWQTRSVEVFLSDWIGLKEWNNAFLERSKLLSIDLNINRRVMIAEFNLDSNVLNKNLWLPILSWDEKDKNDIIARWGNNRIVYFISCTRDPNLELRNKAERFHQFLSKLLKAEVCLGVGSFVPAAQIGISYHQAERAINSRKTNTDIIFDEDLTLEMLLDEVKQQTKEEFVNRTIKTILSETELITTLRALFDNQFSYKNTAHVLHIHINTLHYRLKKITELTGLNTKNIGDLLILFLSLRFLDDYTKK